MYLVLQGDDNHKVDALREVRGLDGIDIFQKMHQTMLTWPCGSKPIKFIADAAAMRAIEVQSFAFSSMTGFSKLWFDANPLSFRLIPIVKK